jgi:NADH dehydrogenase [ubiquinone] 1 alpha subcomplex assembly factor 7
MTTDPEARRDTCLQDPEHGYYVTKPAIGRDSDFITAPEISQVFGELIGLWSAVVWQQMGSPARVNLVELGPGRGTLMRDALRAAAKLSHFVDALSVHLIDSNPRLIEQQRSTLAGASRSISWHASLATVPDAPSIIIANEFLDTASAAQHIGGVERRVTIDGADRLVFTPDAGTIHEQQDHKALVAGLARRAGGMPLAALFFDYGHLTTAPGDTLQALRAHRPEHPLTSPGEADLTVHVDFAAFSRASGAAGLAVDGPLSQGEFLGRLGIVERASHLMSANPAKAGEIELAVARLIAPQGMGSRFKAIAIRSSNLPPLPGFE